MHDKHFHNLSVTHHRHSPHCREICIDNRGLPLSVTYNQHKALTVLLTSVFRCLTVTGFFAGSVAGMHCMCNACFAHTAHAQAAWGVWRGLHTDKSTNNRRRHLPCSELSRMMAVYNLRCNKQLHVAEVFTANKTSRTESCNVSLS